MGARENLEFALANRTGSGFSGDLGFCSANELAFEAGISSIDAQSLLSRMLDEGKVLSDGRGSFAGLPVHCKLCDYDPCVCMQARVAQEEKEGRR